MFEGARRALHEVWRRLTGLRLYLKVAVAAAVALIVGLLLLRSFGQFTTYYVASSYVDELVRVLGINKHLGNAIFWTSFLVLTYFFVLAFSLSKARRVAGALGIVGLLISHSLVLWHGTKDHAFERSGAAAKCYVVTREAIRYGDRIGADPATGLECKPVTPEIVERLEKYAQGNRPKRIVGGTPVFFDPRTGNPVTWYARDPEGGVELFDLMGFHPEKGVALLPVTLEIVALWKEQQSRKAPERIYPTSTATFFDPVRGTPLIWFKRTEQGKYEFYNRAGFDPQTGAPLEVVNKDNVEAIRKHLSDSTTKKCYLLTRDSVRYGATPGLDPETGRQCHLITEELLARLKEYEKGNRPKLVESKTPTMFDPRSGEPILWYWKSSGGIIELYDLMGFHPRTGDELLPITREIAEAYTPKSAPRLPQLVSPSTYQCFDPATGEPKCWYWSNGKDVTEFYDAQGFHPKFGDPLKQVTKDFMVKFDQDARDAENARRRRSEEDRERQSRLSQAAQRCDAMAANPYDRNRVGNGTSFAILKSQSKEAAEACEEAVRQSPNELRFQYQLARALAFSDRPKALQILRTISAKGYPAAFDNMGWILLDTNNNDAAVAAFRRGAELGDPDAMVSLAEMISKGHADVGNPTQAKLSLYSQACRFGHDEACRAAEQEASAVARRQREEEEVRKGLELFGGILRQLPRR